jgi:hypothetical protein
MLSELMKVRRATTITEVVAQVDADANGDYRRICACGCDSQGEMA